MSTQRAARTAKCENFQDPESSLQDNNSDDSQAGEVSEEEEEGNSSESTVVSPRRNDYSANANIYTAQGTQINGATAQLLQHLIPFFNGVGSGFSKDIVKATRIQTKAAAKAQVRAQEAAIALSNVKTKNHVTRQRANYEAIKEQTAAKIQLDIEVTGAKIRVNNIELDAKVKLLEKETLCKERILKAEERGFHSRKLVLELEERIVENQLKLQKYKKEETFTSQGKQVAKISVSIACVLLVIVSVFADLAVFHYPGREIDRPGLEIFLGLMDLLCVVSLHHHLRKVIDMAPAWLQ